ncbi:MAG: hypothetical protein R6U96_10015 [Promethearchaeia archaeon]
MQLFKIDNKGALSELNKLEFIEDDAYIIDDESTIYLWFGNEISKRQKDKAIQKARKLNKDRNGSAKLLSMKQNKEYGSFMAMMDDLQNGIKEGDVPRRAEFKLDIDKSKEIEKKEKQSEKKEIEEEEKKKEIIKSEKKEKQPKEAKEEEEEKELGVHQWLKQQQKYRTTKEEKIEAGSQKKEPIQEPEEDTSNAVVSPETKVQEKSTVEKKEEPEMDFEEDVKTAAYFVSQKGHSYEDLCYILAEKIILEQPFGYASKEQIRKKAKEIFHSSTSYDELCWLIGEMNVLIETNFYNF